MSVPPEEVREELNIAEKLAGQASSSDEYFEAILITLGQIADNVGAGGEGTLGGLDITDLPLGVTGISTGEISGGNTGTAVFNLNGTKMVTRVTAQSDIGENEGLVVVGKDNLVRPGNTERDKMSLASLGVSSFTSDGGEVVQSDNVVNITNEVWEKEDDDTPKIQTVSFDGDLQPGDREVVAKAVDLTGTYEFNARAVGVTSHKADIDNDNEDESVVRYYYQHYDRERGGWVTDDGISGLLPIGSLTTMEELIPGSYVDFSAGMRIVIENRTDDGSFTDTTVSQDEIGGRIKGKVVPSG